VRHRVRSLAASVAFAASLITLAAAPGAQAGAGPAADASWPQFQGNAAHTGLNTGETTLNTGNVSNLELSWIGLVPGNVNWASPVVTGDSVYITAGGGLIVFHKDGCGASTCDPAWIGKTGPQAEATPAVVNGLVYMVSQANPNSNDGRLYVFDANGCGQAECRPLWKGIGAKESFLVSSPAVSGGVVFLGPYDGKLYAFDAGGCGASTCHPLAGAARGRHRHRLAHGRGRQGLRRHRPFHGRLRRKGVRRRHVSSAVAGARPAHGEHARGRERDRVHRRPAVPAALHRDRRRGGVRRRRVWEGPLCQPLWTGVNHATGTESSPVIANGVVYVGKGPASGFPVDSAVFSYDANGCGKTSCAPLGFVQTGEQQFYLASSPAVVDGHVYMGSTDTPTDQAGLYVFALPGG